MPEPDDFHAISISELAFAGNLLAAGAWRAIQPDRGLFPAAGAYSPPTRVSVIDILHEGAGIWYSIPR
jgi:hypothetical protein